MSAPWLDVPPKQNVKKVLFGKVHSASTGTKYSNVVHAVERYQTTPKDEFGQFAARIMQLNAIKDAAVKASAEANSAQNRNYLKQLAERAAGKASYLEEITRYLQQNPDQINDIRGFLKRMSEKRMPTVQLPPLVQQGWQKANVGGGTFAMAGSVAFEQMDPYHREFEVHTGDGTDPWVGAHGGGLGFYMIEWARKVVNEGCNKPFLVWLEKSHACHWSTERHEALGQVQYATDGQLLANTKLIALDGGSRLLQSGPNNNLELFDTHDAVGGKAAKYHGKAYVLTAQGDLIVGIHEAGSLHHSSLVGGGVVRCAGMIGATAGRVHYVDNNSGHYRPPAANLHAFIKYLDSNHLFTPEACTNVQNAEMSITDYLTKGPRSFFGPEAKKIGTHRGPR